jgi:hypothetical protein
MRDDVPDEPVEILCKISFGVQPRKGPACPLESARPASQGRIRGN